MATQKHPPWNYQTPHRIWAIDTLTNHASIAQTLYYFR